MSHLYSLRNEVLEIPLVVFGLPEVSPGVVGEAVEMRGIGQSLRCWALAEECPAALPLPNGESSGAVPGAIFSIYSDKSATMTPEMQKMFQVPEGGPGRDISRIGCTKSDRVFGDMVSVIRYPMKMTWVEGQPFELYDLSWDSGERSNLIEVLPEAAEELREELATFVRNRIIAREQDSSAELSEETARALRSLGYLE